MRFAVGQVSYSVSLLLFMSVVPRVCRLPCPLLCMSLSARVCYSPGLLWPCFLYFVCGSPRLLLSTSRMVRVWCLLMPVAPKISDRLCLSMSRFIVIHVSCCLGHLFLRTMPLWRGGPNTRTLPTVLLTPSASKAADMAHLCVPQNQALGVCRGFVPDIQICGTHGRKNLVNATIISNAEEEEGQSLLT